MRKIFDFFGNNNNNNNNNNNAVNDYEQQTVLALEIWQEIASYLPPSALYNFMLTCKELNASVNDHVFWQHLIQRDYAARALNDELDSPDPLQSKNAYLTYHKERVLEGTEVLNTVERLRKKNNAVFTSTVSQNNLFHDLTLLISAKHHIIDAFIIKELGVEYFKKKIDQAVVIKLLKIALNNKRRAPVEFFLNNLDAFLNQDYFKNYAISSYFSVSQFDLHEEHAKFLQLLIEGFAFLHADQNIEENFDQIKQLMKLVNIGLAQESDFDRLKQTYYLSIFAVLPTESRLNFIKSHFDAYCAVKALKLEKIDDIVVLELLRKLNETNSVAKEADYRIESYVEAALDSLAVAEKELTEKEQVLKQVLLEVHKYDSSLIANCLPKYIMNHASSDKVQKAAAALFHLGGVIEEYRSLAKLFCNVSSRPILAIQEMFAWVLIFSKDGGRKLVQESFSEEAKQNIVVPGIKSYLQTKLKQDGIIAFHESFDFVRELITVDMAQQMQTVVLDSVSMYLNRQLSLKDMLQVHELFAKIGCKYAFSLSLYDEVVAKVYSNLILDEDKQEELWTQRRFLNLYKEHAPEQSVFNMMVAVLVRSAVRLPKYFTKLLDALMNEFGPQCTQMLSSREGFNECNIVRLVHTMTIHVHSDDDYQHFINVLVKPIQQNEHAWLSRGGKTLLAELMNLVPCNSSAYFQKHLKMLILKLVETCPKLACGFDKPKSVLHMAIEHKMDISIIAAILKANPGAVYLQNHDNGNTPLHQAVQSNDDESAKLLISKGAPLDWSNGDGKTVEDMILKDSSTMLMIEVFQKAKSTTGFRVENHSSFAFK